MTEFKYRPDVDGLRAVAVMLVLLFHAGLGFPGGFIGVDVFFVISGFLITGLLLKEQLTEDFRLSNFWIRRIRRILPASTLVVASTLIAAFFVLLPRDYEALAESAIAQQLMISNLYFWRTTGYFGGDAELKPLLHTWSLGVEEQFYLGYPFLVVFLSRFSKPIMFAALLAIGIASFTAAEVGVHSHPSATFYYLPTRAWELLLGGLLCFASQRDSSSEWLANVLSVFGILGILTAACCFDSTTPFPGMSALLPCASTAMVIYANVPKITWVGRLLAAKPIVYMGTMSYSLYLWHWPLLSLMSHLNCGATPDTFNRILALAASFALAALSLKYVESPFRRKTLFPQTKSLLIAVSGSFSLIMACSLTIAFCDGVPQRFDPQALTYASAERSMAFIHQTSTKEVQLCELPHFGDNNGKYKCLIWGDSHAMALIPGLNAVCGKRPILGLQATNNSTPPLLDFYMRTKHGLNEKAPEFNRAVLRFAQSNKVNAVILAAKWSRYADNPDFERCLVHTVQELVHGGIRVAIVRDVADQRNHVPLKLSMAVRMGRNVDEIGIPAIEHSALNKRCNEMIDRLQDGGVLILDPEPLLVDGSGLWRSQFNGEATYRDSHHLSIEGSLRLKPMFEDAFESLGLK